MPRGGVQRRVAGGIARGEPLQIYGRAGQLVEGAQTGGSVQIYRRHYLAEGSSVKGRPQIKSWRMTAEEVDLDLPTKCGSAILFR